MRRALLVAALCTGCTADPPSCVEYYRTVTHGLYGQAKLVETNGDNQPLTKVPISISRYSDRGFDSYVDLRTDEHGLYELDATGGTYSICSDFLNIGCDTIEIGGYTERSLIRIDLHVEEGVSVYWDFPAVGGCP
jgi:hypothetical protein